MSYDDFKDIQREAWKVDDCYFLYNDTSKKKNEVNMVFVTKPKTLSSNVFLKQILSKVLYINKFFQTVKNKDDIKELNRQFYNMTLCKLV